MAGSPRDPLGYYRVLNLSPGANEAEIRLAYTFLKNAWQRDRKIPRSRIKEAYDCLSDPTLKASYDSGKRARAARGARGDRDWVAVGVAGSIMVALLLFAGLIFPGFLLPGPAQFASGSLLVRQKDQAPLGEIVRREPAHLFPNGGSGSAYLVRFADGSEHWYPSSDLENHYRHR